MISEPLLKLGSNAMLTDRSPATTPVMDGASGAATAITDDDCEDSTLAPNTFTAFSFTRYVWALMSPDITSGLAVVPVLRWVQADHVLPLLDE